MEFPTLSDPWEPRAESWRQRGPSRYAGQAGRPLLIGACPRSGTTLLRSLINNHPAIAMPAETDFVLPVWRARVGYGDLRQAENRRAIGRWIFHEDGHGGRRIRDKGQRPEPLSRDEAVERLVAAPPTLGSLLAACFELYAESQGKPRWGDKRPAYAGYVSALFRLFPDAQFVNVIRDPRGAVSSLMGLGWYRKPVAVAASTATWESSVARVDRFARRLRPDQFVDVRYEDLVRDPRATLGRVCAFAGLEHDDAIIDQMLSAERKGNFRPGWHDRLGTAIDTAPITAWSDRLAPGDVAFVEQVTAPFFERFGYVATNPGVAPRPRDLARLELERKRRREKWRGESREELKRRLLYRRPVAAVRGS